MSKEQLEGLEKSYLDYKSSGKLDVIKSRDFYARIKTIKGLKHITYKDKLFKITPSVTPETLNEVIDELVKAPSTKIKHQPLVTKEEKEKEPMYGGQKAKGGWTEHGENIEAMEKFNKKMNEENEAKRIAEEAVRKVEESKGASTSKAMVLTSPDPPAITKSHVSIGQSKLGKGIKQKTTKNTKLVEVKADNSSDIPRAASTPVALPPVSTQNPLVAASNDPLSNIVFKPEDIKPLPGYDRSGNRTDIYGLQVPVIHKPSDIPLFGTAGTTMPTSQTSPGQQPKMIRAGLTPAQTNKDISNHPLIDVNDPFLRNDNNGISNNSERESDERSALNKSLASENTMDQINVPSIQNMIYSGDPNDPNYPKNINTGPSLDNPKPWSQTTEPRVYIDPLTGSIQTQQPLINTIAGDLNNISAIQSNTESGKELTKEKNNEVMTILKSIQDKMKSWDPPTPEWVQKQNISDQNKRMKEEDFIKSQKNYELYIKSAKATGEKLTNQCYGRYGTNGGKLTNAWYPTVEGMEKVHVEPEYKPRFTPIPRYHNQPTIYEHRAGKEFIQGGYMDRITRAKDLEKKLHGKGTYHPISGEFIPDRELY